MPKQPAFPYLRDAMKKKLTRREQFLAEMDVVVPWGRLLALIDPLPARLHFPGKVPYETFCKLMQVARMMLPHLSLRAVLLDDRGNGGGGAGGGVGKARAIARHPAGSL